MSGMGTSNMTIKLWHNGRLIFHLANFDANAAFAVDYYTDFKWNTYSNMNQSSATSRTTYRYEDNVHIREGEPVSCDQIGYATGSTPPPPPPPAPPPSGGLGKPGTPVYVP